MKRTVEEYQEYRRGVVRMAQRKRRKRAEEMGLCLCCIKNKPEPGYKTCRECRLRITAYNRTRKTAQNEK